MMELTEKDILGSLFWIFNKSNMVRTSIINSGGDYKKYIEYSCNIFFVNEFKSFYKVSPEEAKNIRSQYLTSGLFRILHNKFIFTEIGFNRYYDILVL